MARYPEHAPTHAVAGAALFALGRAAEARTALIEAIRINPFDPDPQCTLARVAEEPSEQRDAARACSVLRAN
jgi:cytochrome c-type biogenesis protein CcmH/NrfG